MEEKLILLQDPMHLLNLMFIYKKQKRIYQEDEAT